jgi:hypothetical protein
MFVRDVNLKAPTGVFGELLRDGKVLEIWREDPSSRAFRDALGPWADLSKEFRAEGFQERFPAKGHVERVLLIHSRLMEVLR